MKKNFILIFIFWILMFTDASASVNTDNLKPKKEIFDNKNSRKIKTIQKLLNTKVGKWIVKKNLKKLQKQTLNPQKNKNKKDGAINLLKVMFILSVLFVLGGIAFIIGGGTLIGIIFIILGLLLLGTLVFFISLIGNGFRH